MQVQCHIPIRSAHVKHLLHLLLGRFITTAATIECGDDFSGLDLGNTHNMLSDTELGIGHKARAFTDEPTSLLSPRRASFMME